MKQIITLTILLYLFPCAANAQMPGHVNMPHSVDAQMQLKKIKGLLIASQSNMKTTAIQQRLTAYSSYDDMGSGLVLDDSIHYYYDFGRGSQFDFTYMEYNDYYYYPNFNGDFIRYDSAYVVNGSSANDYATITYAPGNKPTAQTFFANPDYTRNTWTYENTGKVSMATKDTWKPLLMQWFTDYRTFFFNNQLGRVAVDSSEVSGGSTYTPIEKNVYTYDMSGLPINITTYEFNNNNWIEDYRTSVVYNANGLPIEMLFEDYNGTNWINDEKIITSYANDMYKVSEFDSLWNVAGSNWYPVSEEYRRLNTQNIPDSIFYRSMYNLNQWDTSISMIAYNSFNNPSDISYYTGAQMLYEKDHFFYQDYDPTAIAATDHKAEVTVYPNPATDRIFISTKDLNKGVANRYTIWSSNGSMIKNGEVPAQSEPYSITIGDLAPGVYLIRIGSSKEQAVSTFVRR